MESQPLSTAQKILEWSRTRPAWQSDVLRRAFSEGACLAYNLTRPVFFEVEHDTTVASRDGAERMPNANGVSIPELRRRAEAAGYNAK